MGRFLYIMAVILTITWAIIFLGGFVTTHYIHLLLIIAVILVILNLMEGGGQGARRL